MNKTGELREYAHALANRLDEDGKVRDAEIIRGLLALQDAPREVIVKCWDGDNPEYGGAKVTATLTVSPIMIAIDMRDDAGSDSCVMIECDKGLAAVRHYMPIPVADRGPGELGSSDSPVAGVIFGAEKSVIFVGENYEHLLDVSTNELGFSIKTSKALAGNDDSFSRMRIGIKVPPAADDTPVTGRNSEVEPNIPEPS